MPKPLTHFITGSIITIFIITIPLLVFAKDITEILTILMYSAIIIASNVLIDFDHYVASCKKMKRILSLKESYEYHDKVIAYELKDKTKNPGDFHVLHTVEAHVLILCMSFITPIFYAIFVGMLIHSIIDYIDLKARDRVYRRSYFVYRKS